MPSRWDRLKHDHPLQIGIGLGLFAFGVITVAIVREEGTLLSPGWALLMLLELLAIGITYLLIAWLQHLWGAPMSFRTSLRIFPFVWCVVSVLLLAIALAKKKFKLADTVSVCSCYEAGRDGFWLHRWLIEHGIGNRREYRPQGLRVLLR